LKYDKFQCFLIISKSRVAHPLKFVVGSAKELWRGASGPRTRV
jgi:hypothetical protein